MAKVTIGFDEKNNEKLKEIIKTTSFEVFDQHLKLSEHKHKTKVMLNGNWIGFMNGEPDVLVEFIKLGRSTGLIPDEISVVRDIVQR